MKLFKRLSLFLVLVLVTLASSVMLSACGGSDDDTETVATLNGKTPIEVYRAAEEKLDNVSNAKISGDAKIKIEISGSGMSLTESMDMTILSEKNGESIHTKMEATANGYAETEMLEEEWFVNGMLYTYSKEGTDLSKTKESMTYDEYVNSDSGSGDDDFLIEFEDEVLENAKFTKSGGKYHINVTLTGDEVNDLTSDMIDSIAGGFEFDKVVYKLSFNKDGDLVGMTISFSGSMTAEGATMSMEITIKLAITYGNVGVINPPADSSTYVSADGYGY